jgi:endonuclease/exonuclease/phosphatase family metal-dependent hydrolase
MPYYTGLKFGTQFTTADRQRAAGRLLALRELLKAKIPARTRSDTLLLATWNIRDFDSNKFGHGPRLPESFYYIAEIIAAFDLVAVQEVNANLRALQRLMPILGPDWDYIVTDVTEGTSGNDERIAFLFDKNKVSFLNQVGEVVLPDVQLIEGKRQFARTPFYATFQAGWFKFNLCTVHIYYGEDSGPALARRIEEIDRLTGFMADRAKREGGTYIVLGDFNVVSPEHQTMQALLRHGFTVPEPLRNAPTNLFQTKHYDQIAFLGPRDAIQLGPSAANAGAFNYYERLFTPEMADVYYGLFTPARRKKWDTNSDGSPRDLDSRHAYYADLWRTWQMSDHLPMWVELKIDFSTPYLTALTLPLPQSSNPEP